MGEKAPSRSKKRTHNPFPPPHIDEREAARILGISVRTLQTWRVTGGGPPFVKVGAAVRYNPDRLADWLEARTVSNTAQAAGVAR